jgi:hypothetical protein
MFGMLVIDVVSSLPIEIMLPGSILRMFNILKIIRVFRLTTIINKMNAEEESKSVSFKLINLINFMYRCSEWPSWYSSLFFACI